jgi:hypothetical protein
VQTSSVTTLGEVSYSVRIRVLFRECLRSSAMIPKEFTGDIMGEGRPEDRQAYKARY